MQPYKPYPIEQSRMGPLLRLRIYSYLHTAPRSNGKMVRYSHRDKAERWVLSYDPTTRWMVRYTII